MLYRSDQSRTITRLAFSLNQSFGDLSPANFGAISLYKSYSLISGIVKFLVARSSYPFSFDSNGRINYLSGTNVIMNRLALSLTGTNPFLVFRLVFPRAIRSGPICLYACGRSNSLDLHSINTVISIFPSISSASAMSISP